MHALKVGYLRLVLMAMAGGLDWMRDKGDFSPHL